MNHKKYSVKRFKQLAGIINEQVDMVADMENSTVPIVSSEPDLAPIQLSDDDELSKESSTDELKNWLAGYVSYLRAIHLWFHAAHHLTKGTSFSGDHVSLYQRIYTEVQDEIDGAIEKAIGITEDENLACPIMITSNAVNIMKEAGCNVDSPADEIAEAGLELEKAYVEFVETMFKDLEDLDVLTLGLNDQLAASANTHETYVYLLGQRVKVD